MGTKSSVEAANWSVNMDEMRNEDILSNPGGSETFTMDWKDLLFIILANIAILFGGATLLSLFPGTNPTGGILGNGPSLSFNVGLAAIESFTLVSSVYFIGLRRRKMSWTDIGLRPAPSKWVFRAVVIALLFIPLIGSIVIFIQFLLGAPAENPQLEFLAPKNFSWLGAMGMFLLGGIAVPFAEELFFRGVLYKFIRVRWGVVAGMLISAFVFGALHGDLSIAGATFIMGLLLAWFFERTKSLWPSVAIHVTNNSVKILLLYTLIALGVEFPDF